MIRFLGCSVLRFVQLDRISARRSIATGSTPRETYLRTWVSTRYPDPETVKITWRPGASFGPLPEGLLTKRWKRLRPPG